MKLEAYRTMEELEDSYWWYRARRDIVSSILRRCLAPGSEIVDFGCGAGGIARELQALGYRVLAADNSEHALSLCRRAGLETIDLSVERLTEGCADGVFAGDVLEHVEDDITLLSELRGALRDGGYLIATVPAYEFLWSGEDYVSDHVRRYTRSTLREHILSAGFSIVWCSYFNTILFPFTFTIILVKRIFQPRAMYQTDISPLPRWMNEMLYKLFALERYLLRWLRFPVGASLIVVAKAPPRPLQGAG
jgi:SAM-dependent methyltransferase